MTPQETEKIKLMQLFKQGKIDTLPDVDSNAYKASKVKDMMSKAEGVDEITSKVGSRISGMIHRPFLANILEKFAELYQDLIDNGEEFEPQDVIDFLSIEMSKFADDRKMGPMFFEGENDTPGPKNPDGTPKSNDEMTDDEREDYYNNLDDVNEETVDEGVKWMKRFSGIK